ncbi:MAG TPA: DsbC family protein [Steroidobacteraceae bacterium]|jgi:thiol:disulfide interchange protein DsbC|nr:DsbC family protein [Steroidobacteraceae bacterium]
MLRYAAALSLVLCAVTAGASARAANADQAAADPRAALLKLLPAGSKLEDLRPSPIAGIYEFTQGAEVSYLTADGKYFIDGNLYDMKSRDNLTESLRTHARIALIGSVPESEMLIFSPPNPKYTITVFTDVDCAYCRKLHSQMAELNKLGIRVRYMFYPRSGPGTESWKKAEVVWCSPDRNEALTRAKAGATLDMNKICSPTPVKREYELGENIGVRGTPAIFTENGDYISGYMEPRELLDQLKELQVAKR